MNNLPKRRPIRIEDYDYSTQGAYFITVCTVNREKIFWNLVGADMSTPKAKPSACGNLGRRVFWRNRSQLIAVL